MKIKLIAIAKDEAAYLPEWIFHHLYFGFDEIEIYVNYTRDNSYALLEKICKNYSVKYKNAEYLVDQDYNQYDSIIAEYFLGNPIQSRAYAEAFAQSKTTDFTHVMFLDIDEYWTPSCFTKNIKEILTELGDPAVTSFSWKNKVGETAEFDRPFQEDNLYLDTTIEKMVVKTELDIKIINPHKCTIDNKDNHHKVHLQEKNSSFILHRIQRSEMEYVSLLGRGDVRYLDKFGLKFNRGGFISPDNSLNFSIDKVILDKYNDSYKNFILQNDLVKEIELGKKFVSDRADVVLDYISENVKANKIINKVIKGLSIEMELYPNRCK